MQRLRAAVAVGFLMGTLVLAGAAAAAPAPPPRAPGDLWRNFPLEPRTETGPVTPAPATTPAQAPAQPTGVGPAVVRPAESSDDSQTPWILLGIGAGVVAAIAAAALLFARRRRSAPERVARTSEPEPEPIVQPAPRTLARAVSNARPRAAEAVEPTARATRRTEPSLVEMLSPRLHLEEEGEPAEQKKQPEQQEEIAAAPEALAPGTCEIRWWRGRAECRFYIEAEPPLLEKIESPAFRARGRRAPVRNTAAQAAHEIVVKSVVAAGWRPNGRGAQWFSDRFTSALVGAEAEPAEVPEEPAATPEPDEQESESKDGRNSSFVW